MTEWTALGGSPSEFWRQTPRSYIAIMEGMARAASRQADLAIVNAWHTAIFVLNGYAGKLKGKSLSDFLSGDRVQAKRRSTYADAHAFFGRLKAEGFPIETRH